MQRIIQINLAGRVIPIEEDAYLKLRDYIAALNRQFAGEDGKEIIGDIENRISELFTIRLQNGTPAINALDVDKVIETLGAPADINDGNTDSKYTGRGGYSNPGYRQYEPRRERLLRDPFNKVIGGVCSGVAHYFDIDPVLVRIIMAVLFFSFGIGLLAYIIAWAVIPAAKSKAELYNNYPLTFHDVTRSVAVELDDLKARAEQMSRELKDFFGKRR